MRALPRLIARSLLAPLALALLAAAGCTSPPALYPHPFIGRQSEAAAAAAATPETAAAFRARHITDPAPRKAAGLAEAYIAAQLEHPSSAQFTGLFESTGKSPAVCGFVRDEGRDGAATGWRPFVVEWTRAFAKGESVSGSAEAETALARLCGPMPPPAAGAGG
ncbi:hypothetical protein [Acidisoma sp. C75]